MVPEIRIDWPPPAAAPYNRIIDFLLDLWGPDIAESFAGIVHRKLNALISTPEIGMVVKTRPEIRMTVLHKNAVLYYSYHADIKLIELISFWDTRENPYRKKFLQ